MREWVESLRPEQRGFARVLGGIALAASALSLFIRKSNHESWGSFGRLLVLLIPCVVLYGAALGLGDRELGRDATPPIDRGLLVRSRRTAAAWQSVFAVLGVLLVPLVLFQFLDMLGGETGNALNVAWIFLVTAALALYIGFATGVSYTALLASLGVIVAWLALCDKLFNPSASTFRWLLIVIAIALAVAAVQLDRFDVRQAPEFMTGAGLAAVAAGILGLIAAAIGFVGTSLARAFGSTAAATGVRQHQEWNVLLLVIAVALIWYGNRRAARGPTYVGGVALIAFVISVGAELTRLFSGNGQGDGSFLGWPLLLLVVAGTSLAVGYWLPPAAAPPPPVNSGEPIH